MRLNKLKQLLETKNLKCAVIVDSSTIFYLTGYDYITTDIGNFIALVYCDEVPRLIVPLLEVYRAENKVKNRIDVVAYSSTFSDEKVIKGSLKDAILKFVKYENIGLDVQNTATSFYNQLSKLNIIDISKDLSLMRAIKEPEELELIKRAWEITSVAMKVSQERVNTRLSEKNLAGIIDMTMRSEGAQDYAFPSIVAFGENSAYPHHVPTDKTIKEGENAVIDIGARYENYCFDSTRTFIIGTNQEIKRIYEIVLEAQLEAIDNVREGVKASEVDLAARRVIEKYGYGKYFIHSTGHGVGINVHEYPSISPTSDAELKENMVITIEPGIYINNKFGVRIEDTIIVTKNKPIVLETTYKYI